MAILAMLEHERDFRGIGHVGAVREPRLSKLTNEHGVRWGSAPPLCGKALPFRLGDYIFSCPARLPRFFGEGARKRFMRGFPQRKGAAFPRSKRRSRRFHRCGTTLYPQETAYRNHARPAGCGDAGQERLGAFAAFSASRIFEPYFCTRHSPRPRTFVRSSKPRAGMRTISSSHLFCATM